jgi:hypothetical protein
MNAFQSRLNVGIFYDDDRIECWAKVVKMGLRFEFDPANKILMTRLEGELTDELVIQTDAGMRKHLLEKGPHIHIVDAHPLASSPYPANPFAPWRGDSPRFMGGAVVASS